MAQQKIFKSRLSAKDFIKFNHKSEQNNAVHGSPRWQYYSAGGGSQRIVISPERHRLCSDHFKLVDRKHVTRVSVNTHGSAAAAAAAANGTKGYHSKSLSDLRLLPDVTSSVCDFKNHFVFSFITLNYIPIRYSYNFDHQFTVCFRLCKGMPCSRCIKNICIKYLIFSEFYHLDIDMSLVHLNLII